MSKTRWLKLGVVAAALLLIPRRSSRNDHTQPLSDINPKKPKDMLKQRQSQPRQSDE